MLNTKMIPSSNQQVFTKYVEFLENPTIGKKAYRSEEVVNSTVIVDNIQFDADETSMDRMDRIIDLANWKYNQTISQGVPAQTAYAAVYQSTEIPWKTADNQLVQVSVEQICRAQELALNNLGEIWVKYG